MGVWESLADLPLEITAVTLEPMTLATGGDRHGIVVDPTTQTPGNEVLPIVPSAGSLPGATVGVDGSTTASHGPRSSWPSKRQTRSRPKRERGQTAVNRR